MQNPDQDQAMQEEGQESPPSSPESGYAITVLVSPSGFSIRGPEPLPASPSEPTDEEEPVYPDITAALKQILAIVKEHPIGQDEQAGFKSATSTMDS